MPRRKPRYPARFRKRTFSPEEGAEYVGISLRYFRKFLRSGAIRSIRVGRNYRIPIEVLDRWLASAGNEAGDAA